MGPESVMAIGMDLGIMKATKDLGEWGYAKLLVHARECCKLNGLRWTKSRRTRYELLAQVTAVSFALSMVMALAREKILVAWFVGVFALSMASFGIVPSVIPGLINAGKVFRRKRGRG